MGDCQLCEHEEQERISALERQLTLGRVSILEASRQLGVDEKEVWEHLKHASADGEVTKSNGDGVEDRLEVLMKKLNLVVDDLLAMPSQEHLRQTPSLIKELRETIKMLGQHRGELSPDVAVQINMVNYYNQWLLENLCNECKMKFAKQLEVWEAKEAQ